MSPGQGGPLVLIEPYAHLGGGHHQRTLAALAACRPGSLVIAPCGLADEITMPDNAGARVVTRPAGSAAAVLAAGASAAERSSAVGQRIFASRRWPAGARRLPHQITLIARCLTEAACLRTARHLAPAPACVVILSASEALHGAAALLGGGKHLRFIHEAVTTEDLPVRLLGRLARRGEKRALALYPTAAVRDQLAPAFPRLPCTVRAFAVDDGRRLTAAERISARAAFAIPASEKAVCLVGGWWPYKDTATVGAALARLTEPLHLLVCGSPLDETVLDRWHQLPRVRLHALPAPAGEQFLRLVYAAADATIVARRPGAGKESGLVMDAVRLGVPLIVSRHDPGLTSRLDGQPWTWLFPASDAGALAATLDRLAHTVPERPGPRAPRLAGMHPAVEQADFLAGTYARLLSEGL